MPNKYTFSSTVNNKKNFESIVNATKNFFSTIKNSHVFNTIVDGFTPDETWFARFISNSVITVSNIASQKKDTARFIFNDIVITIVDALITLSINPRITFTQRSTIRAVARAVQKMGTAEFIFPSNITIRVTDTSNITNSLFSFIESINATATVKQYYLLSYYSGSTLQSLATTTLADMAYQVV